jgi:hypothetical protein
MKMRIVFKQLIAIDKKNNWKNRQISAGFYRSKTFLKPAGHRPDRTGGKF